METVDEVQRMTPMQFDQATRDAMCRAGSVSRSREEHHVLRIDRWLLRWKPRSGRLNEADQADECADAHSATHVRLASQETRNTNEATSFRSRSNAHASLKQRSFDRAASLIDTRFDRLAMRALHTLMNKVLYQGRNANRKQDFS
ncbi:hypothetical protein J8I87_19580 [Paraburkholderia sp. LEh10]|uniref:hypothetical protein n=1 Tax=Paraburkholderia sp. LEh10 TaxID=2821353 RepID=UPI001AE57F11|nr:hypothetical protein [Paraburkholderia sp. LEh10]MBP0591887.1 hypothetical protein [Paraburkholderia sp. LEh10]